jgi:hypothetical protein
MRLEVRQFRREGASRSYHLPLWAFFATRRVSKGQRIAGTLTSYQGYGAGRNDRRRGFDR